MNIESVVQAIISGLLTGGIYSLSAVGLSLIFGVMGIVNFTHGSLMMIAMYATFWLVTLLGFNPYATLIIVIPLLFIIGALIQHFFINKILSANEAIQILLTLGIALWIENMVLIIWGADFRSLPSTDKIANIYIANISMNLPRLYAFLIALVSVILLALFLKRTDLGLAINAAAKNKDGARLVGINVKKIFIVAFGIGVACVGVSGTLLVPFLFVYPEVGYMFMLVSFVVVVMGGMGNIMGAFYSGLIVGVIEALGGLFLQGSLKKAIVYFIFITVLLFKPEGLFSSEEKNN